MTNPWHIPIWALFIIPETILPITILNIIFYTLVFILILTFRKVVNKKLVFKKSILKIIIFSLISDALGKGIMFSICFSNPFAIFEAIYTNPFSSIVSLIITLPVIALCIILVYFLDSKFAFKNTNLEMIEQKKISLILAIFTAPWIFLLPTDWLY